MKRAWMLALPCLAWLGCDASGNPGMNTTKGSEVQVVTMDDQLAFLDQAQERIFAVDPAVRDLKPRVFKTHAQPLWAEKRNATNELLVLSAGKATGKDAEPARLSRQILVDGQADVPLDLPARYNRLNQSSDGRFAILSFDGNGAASAGTLLYNPNDLYVVDFTASQPGRSRPIRSLGGKPENVVFAPRATLFGRERTLAVVFSTNYITLFEVDAPKPPAAEPKEITISLSPDGSRTVVPTQILFDMDRPAIYVLADGSNDVFHVSLDANDAPKGNENDFRATLSLMGAGQSPRSMAMYGVGSARRLLVTSPASGQIVVLNPKTGDSTPIQIAMAPDTIFTFTGASPKDTQPKERALLLNLGKGSNAVAFADLENIESSKEMGLESWPASANLQRATPLSAQKGVLVEYKGNSASAGLSLVDLEERTILPMGATGLLGAIAVDPTQNGRVWSSDLGNRLVYIDIAKGVFLPGEVRLDDVIASVIALPKPSADAIRYVVALHKQGNRVGGLTVLPADKPTRAEARSIFGFTFANYLDRGQP